MEKIIDFRLKVKNDFGSDHVEELRHIDKYFSKYINSHVEIVEMELESDHNKDFTLEINGVEMEDTSISTIVDYVNQIVMKG